ncbi:hypothetical protein [Pedobacter sp. Hv1]|uniref:hypothetical protein n=1 Tax=Pedobacter sp. Hv1 TaxID=1740090 RepID=UPI0006D8A1B8|nr:hypothetical protein [Pedobacter sp. Hv1]KQB99468.1 hypothetical protein AQF98_18050 [Pedobacter sp. Hv1]
MKDKVEFRKVREFGEIIGDTFLFVKQNFKPLLKAFIYLCGFFILAGMANAMVVQLRLVNIAANPGDYTPYSRLGAIFSWHYLGLIVFMVLNYTAIYVTVLSYISIYIQKGNVPVTVEEVWSYFKYYFFRMLGSGVIMTVFLFVCLLFCFFPGVYVFPAVTLVYPILILENASLGYSFTRSFKLLKDNWWITFGILVVIWIITYACTTFVQLPAIIITMVNTFTNPSNPISKSYAIISSLSSYIAQVFLIIPIICSALCYFSLVEQKESTGLLDRIEGFGDTNSEQSTTSPEEY